jgi:hypothetical protein
LHAQSVIASLAAGLLLLAGHCTQTFKAVFS